MAPKRPAKPTGGEKKSTKPNKDGKKTAGGDSTKKSCKVDKEERNTCSPTAVPQQPTTTQTTATTTPTTSTKMTLCTYPVVGGCNNNGGSGGATTNGTVRSSQHQQQTSSTSPAMSPNSGVRERGRPGRPPSHGKRMSLMREMPPAKVRSAYRRSLDHHHPTCDNSNDSGLGFDHHTDPHQMSMSDRVTWSGERAEVKRPRMDIKLEREDIGESYSFPDTMRTNKENTTLIRTAPSGSVPSLTMNNNQNSASGRAMPRCMPLGNRPISSTPISLTTQFSSSSRCKDVSLTIVKQPEQQHRARYQTEGSRGAVKDREGNGFPIVQLQGYYQPATLQVFIGTDVGKVAPHMFYQACKVSGKNSTPCTEKKIDGTCVIELQLDPAKEMSATCDCVGILKERNVDVEHRFPDQLGNRSKKKSTRCRMIFRTTLVHEDGTQETLQVCSQPIVCTQPPGVPEICKKSLTSCPASGGLELFVLGKNFLKDTRVYIQQTSGDDRQVQWEQIVVPDKEYLQQTHFVCVIPPYHRPDITEPVTVRLCVVSSGKTSEPHQFVYTPVTGAIPSVHGDHQQQHQQSSMPSQQQGPFFNKLMWSTSLNKREQDLGMMPPPESSMVPARRPSISVPSTSDVHSPPMRSTIKPEYMDDNSQNSMDMVHTERYRHISESSLDVHHGDSNMSMINDNSIDIMNQNSMLSHNDNSNDNNHNNGGAGLTSRRNSMNSSMDVNMGNSRLSVVSEDSSCGGPTMHCSNSVVTDRLVLAQSSLLRKNLMTTTTTHSTPTPEELKPFDLRMKMPMATVADLVNSSAPSMATLQSFGVTEGSSVSLPAQSAQSVENFLTNIESKTSSMVVDSMRTQTELQMKNSVTDKIEEMICGAPSSKLLSQRGLLVVPATTAVQSEPVFLSTQRTSFLNGAVTTQSEAMQIVAKSEAAAIAEQTIPEQTSTMATSITTISTMSAGSLESNISTSVINTERLDALVNSTLESHIGSPPNRSDPTKDPATTTSNMMMSNKLTLNTNPSDMLLTSGDVMLNSRPSLMVPPMINTSLSQSPTGMLTQPDLGHSHNSPNLPPEVILNSQISPSMMCRSSQDTLAAICQPPPNVEQTLLPITPQQQPSNVVMPSIPSPNNNNTNTLQHSPIHQVNNNPLLVANSDPEKVVLLKAAVDLLETQKKLSALDHHHQRVGQQQQQQQTKDVDKEATITNIVDNIITMAQTTNTDVMSSNTHLTSTDALSQNSRLSQLPVGNTSFAQQQSSFVTTATTQNGNITVTSARPSSMTILNKTMVTQQQPQQPQDTNKSDFVIPVPVKEITGVTTTAQSQDKKNEDRMIPQSFTSLTENELINLINPSCFDQGNNGNYH